MTTQKQQQTRIDSKIKIRQARVIDENGVQLGVLTIEEAMALARERELNLVEVAPNAKPPVCKIMDFGKFKYTQKKKEHQARVKQHQVTLKEIRLRPKIDKHDLETKVKSAKKFLDRGDRVQFNMLFRGRERGCQGLGQEVMKEIIETLSEISKVEKFPKMEGRRMTMMLVKK